MNSAILLAACVLYCAAAHAAHASPLTRARRDISPPTCPPGTRPGPGEYNIYCFEIMPEGFSDKKRLRIAAPTDSMIERCPLGYKLLPQVGCVRQMPGPTPPPTYPDDDEYYM